MKILLDTHILLWALSNDPKLPEKAARLIASEENEIFYSLASIWEVEHRYISHPEQMPINARALAGFCREAGYHMLPIKEEHIYELASITRREDIKPHKNPFDRIMICQARRENMLFLTHASLLDGYGEPYVCVV